MKFNHNKATCDVNLLTRCIFFNIPLTLKIFYVHVQNTNYAELSFILLGNAGGFLNGGVSELLL